MLKLLSKTCNFQIVLQNFRNALEWYHRISSVRKIGVEVSLIFASDAKVLA